MIKKSLIARILLSIFAIFFLYKSIDTVKFLENARRANLFYLLLSFLMICANYIISGFRWRSLIFFSDKYKGWGVLELIKLYFSGAFFNNFMPTSIGGDVYKAVVLGKETGDTAKSIAATFINRLSGFVVLAFLASLSLVFLLGFLGIALFVLFWLGAVTGMLFLGFFSRYSKKIKKFHESLLSYRIHKKAIIRSLFFSIFVQLAANLAGYFATKSLGINISLTQAFFAFPIIGFLSFLPLSFNGIGIQDALYKLIFTRWGFGPETALASSAFYHVIRMLVSLIGGVFLLKNNEHKKKN